jgi:hypothetical protein
MASYYGTAVIPARVKRPRDKPNAENGVLNVERRIIAKLRNRIFFSLTELNQAIWAELKLLNEKPFQKLDGSRQSLYEELEKPALKPLPPKPFEYAVWKKLTVNIDYHVEVNKNYYSTPYQLVKEIVEVRITASVVEIFHRGKRVASHRLLLGKGKFSTLLSTVRLPIKNIWSGLRHGLPAGRRRPGLIPKRWLPKLWRINLIPSRATAPA